MNSPEELFPRLAAGGYDLTSPSTDMYNCIAWAAGEVDRWWWPDPMGVDFWPEGAPREETLPAFLDAFAILGFERTTSADPEQNVCKVAIYALEGLPTHAARQLPLPNGRWTSKLGRAEDIEHNLEGLVGDIYGEVVAILARREG